jgi:signal transduction histidine kinase
MGKKVFIVEDEMILNEQLKNFLQKHGYEVEMFPHGEPCLQAMENGLVPDLILMDINLGRNRMDGPAVTKKIYEKYDVPVVLHSAYTDKATLDSTRDMTKYGYIQKVPGNEQFILATIDMALKLFEQTKAHRDSEHKYRELLQHYQNVREEQNAYIAREVHDELGQSLTSLRMGLAILEEDLQGHLKGSLPAEIEKKMAEMKETICTTIEKTRELSHHLKPAGLDSSGVFEALRWQTCEFRRKFNLPVQLDIPEGEVHMDKGKSLAVYRIVQEAFTNTARYAEASEVRVVAGLSKGALEMKIRDNGKGFDPECKGIHDSFGLLGMKERAKQFGGDVWVSSEPGAGTEVQMRMPLQ